MSWFSGPKKQVFGSEVPVNPSFGIKPPNNSYVNPFFSPTKVLNPVYGVPGATVKELNEIAKLIYNNIRNNIVCDELDNFISDTYKDEFRKNQISDVDVTKIINMVKKYKGCPLTGGRRKSKQSRQSRRSRRSRSRQSRRRQS